MKLERAKNTKRNMLFGFINKIICMLFPFVIRTIIIRIIGKEYLGLDSLFTSILQVLNLAEMGFSSAVVYNMYKPIAEENDDLLCQILKFYKKVYFAIGMVILFAGISILPFLTRFINGEYPQNVNIYVLYILYLLNTVISYIMFAYRGALLNAYQRFDVESNISTASKILCYVLQIVLLLKTKNYYLYVAALVISTTFNNILTQYYTKKLFPNIEGRGVLNQEVRKDISVKIKGLMISKLCDTSRNAFDSIFVSSFIGLVQTAIYNNYFMIMNAVIMLLSIISRSIIGGVGNSIAVESSEKNYSDLRKLNFGYMWISGWCTICMACLYQPFTELVFGKDMLFPMSTVVMFCVYFYVLKMGDMRSVYFEAAGLWWENRFKSLVEAGLNLILNYVLGKYYGVKGIILATLISLFFINFVWGSNLIFKYYFKSISSKEYYTQHLLYACVTSINAFLTCKICSAVTVSGIVGLFFKGVICLVFPNIIFLLVYCKTSIFKNAMPWLLKKLNA